MYCAHNPAVGSISECELKIEIPASLVYEIDAMQRANRGKHLLITLQPSERILKNHFMKKIQAIIKTGMMNVYTSILQNGLR